MTDSVRLGIMKQLAAQIQTITPANGYTHDLSAAVFRGRFWFGEEDPLPMVSILEGLTPDKAPTTAGFHQREQMDYWPLLIQGWVADDAENPTDPAHALMAEVKQALGQLRAQVNDFSLTGPFKGHVAEMTIQPGVVRPPEQLSPKAYFWLQIVLKTVEDVENPFL